MRSADRLPQLLGVVARFVHSPAHAVRLQSGRLGSQQQGHRLLRTTVEPRVEMAKGYPGMHPVVSIANTRMPSPVMIDL